MESSNANYSRRKENSNMIWNSRIANRWWPDVKDGRSFVKWASQNHRRLDGVPSHVLNLGKKGFGSASPALHSHPSFTLLKLTFTSLACPALACQARVLKKRWLFIHDALIQLISQSSLREELVTNRVFVVIVRLDAAARLHIPYFDLKWNYDYQ